MAKGSVADSRVGDDGRRRLRVLFLTGFPAIGGPLPKLAKIVADGLSRLGCDVQVMGWSAHSAGPETVMRKVRDRLADLARVRARVVAWSPDVVFVATTHNWPALLRDVPLALCLRRRAPLVLHFHGSECASLGQPGEWLFTALSLWLVRQAAAVLVLSREEYDAWTRMCPDVRFELVANPHLRVRSEPAPVDAAVARRRDLTFLFVGRLVRDKGIFDLLEAFRIVRQAHPCRLVIAGDGPEAAAVRRQLALLRISGAVSMLGYVTGSRLADAYRAADIFVLPSYREGLPLVVLEAMDYGLPVITTRIRGCADHLEPHVNAEFVVPGDPESLAAGMTRLLEDDVARVRMGVANWRKVADFAPGIVIPRYAEILRSAAVRQGR